MSKYSRRQVIEAALGAAVSAPAITALYAPSMAEAGERSLHIAVRLAVNASVPPTRPEIGLLHMGTARRPDGLFLTADSRSLLWNSRSWLPVMGEFHYARYPAAEWRNELLKMRAGGIDIIASYVFWIHHEEEEGHWNWTGQRSLRDFVRLCAEIGLYAVVRCGPWCHGEVRNGGFPDWLLKKNVRLRSDDSGYLDCVRRLYEQIATQLNGLLWKDGGCVVGLQIENEYGGAAEHLLTLKRLARKVGLDVPLYTRTGWPALATPMPPGELLPLFGSYAEGFWDRELTPMPGKYGDGFRFILARDATSAAIGTDLRPADREREGDEVGRYPYFCCEIGGGMETSYHRRIDMEPSDVESSALVKIGSGNNLQGYYMFHGGTNPDGKLSTLQESQQTRYWNDLPVKSYDYQSPLGEFGQIRPHYHGLRRLHLFLRDWGSVLATQPARLPDITPANSKDTTTLRWTVRCDSHSGFVFVNNYQRLQSMPAKADIQFRVRLEDSELCLPSEPFTVPANSAFFWPFNLDLRGVTLVHATAQPVCKVENGNILCVVFAQTAGVPAEFVFDSQGVTVVSASGHVTRTDSKLYVRQVKTGTEAAIRLNTARGPIDIVLLDAAVSLTCWKGALQGREHLFLTPAGLTLEEDAIELNAARVADLTVAIYPPAAKIDVDGLKVTESKDGLFHRCTVSPRPTVPMTATAESLRPAGPARDVPMGSEGVAEAPSDESFAQAGAWRIRLQGPSDADRDPLLLIRYVGDAARLTLDGSLLTDNFYNGKPFEIGLKRYAPAIYQQELLLEILPLRRDAPIYLPPEAQPDFGDARDVARVTSLNVIERHTVQIKIKETQDELPGDFLAGADCSHVGFFEMRGKVYRENGVVSDPFLILRRDGINCVRLRLFTDGNADTTGDPYNTINNLKYTVPLAARVRRAGLRFLLDFHYSDTWADPARQSRPKGWNDLSFDQLEQRMFAYNRDCIAAFKRAGAMPDYVQAGNEITSGILWPDGRVGGEYDTPEQWTKLGRLMKAAIGGMKEAAGDDMPKLMIHIDRGGDWKATQWFFDHLREQQVDFDIIGESYYPFWHGSLTDLQTCLTRAAQRYRKPVIVAETAFPRDMHTRGDRAIVGIVPGREGQVQFMQKLTAIVKGVPNGRGAGIFYWAAEFQPLSDTDLAGFEESSFFDDDGDALPVIRAFGQLAR